ncbi:POF1B isoform X1 [Pelobates cultripes]|uniref:POF1B isoform X1 n=1 Tax=Pelobates cultripes TaxID=61616 RepID=A0AAD1SZ62_PELCU|nr:POF1B isoform X1 [Pelobates cultripes]
MSTSSYRENGSVSDRDNVFIERVRKYSPVTKMVQVLDGNSVLPMSPSAHSPGPSFQTMAWGQEPVHHIQETQSPTYSQGTIRRYIVQNPEPEVQSPTYSQGTIRRYIVQNPETEVHSPPYSQETIRRYIVQNNEQEVAVPYPQQTIRRYIVQNPEQEIQAPYQHETVRRYIVQNPEQQTYVQGVNYVPQNNVVYEKTIRRVEVQKPEVERTSSVSIGSQQTSTSEQVTEQINQINVSSKSSEQEVISEQVIQTSVSSEQKTVMDTGPDQLDARYFGELLAELSRKNSDLYSCLLQHVEKIGGRKPSDSEYETGEDIEALIPKGVSELTKQQIRYLLQMRHTSDKSLRLVLSTFSNLREDLLHLQNDLNKLETDKKSLERDLSFKDAQIKEYETIVASLREKNRQQQQELKDSALRLRSVEESMLSQRNTDSDKDYRLKELEYAKNALQQENQTLRVQISETCSSPVLQAKTDEITRHYKEMINNLSEEKDKEIRNLRIQITKFQRDVSAREGSSSDLQLRLLELTASLEERESLIKRQQEELLRLRQEREGKSVNQTVITERYRTDYPILGLLNDYKNTSSPVKERQTIVVKRTGW